MKLLSLLTLLFWTTLSPLSAEDILYSTLKNGIGIRPLTLGNAFTAIGENGEGSYYNPAGISQAGFQLSTEQLDQTDTRYSQLSGTHLYLSPFSASFYERRSKENDVVRVQSISMGTQTNRGIDWGITYKSVQSTINDQKQSGWSGDVGILAHMTPKLTLGFTAKDILSNDLDIPSTWRTGLAYTAFDRRLTLSTDLINDYKNGNTQFSTGIGAEALLTEGLTLRGGLHKTHASAGVSLKLPLGTLSYSVLTPTNGDDPTYLIAGSIGLGPLKTPAETRQKAIIKDPAYAVFSLSGNLIKGQSEISLLGGQKIGMNDLLKWVEDAKNDPSCKGFIIKLGSMSSDITTIALIQELRQTLQEAKEKGKTIFVYIDGYARLPEYYLASIATKIIMPKLGQLSHLGLELEVTKTKELFKNFGFSTQIIKSGLYKATLNANSDEISAEERTLLESLLQRIYHQTLTDIQDNRRLSWDTITNLFNGRIVSASEAKEKGLIDQIGYYKSLEDFLKLKHVDPKNPEYTAIAYPLSHFSKPAEKATLFHFNNQIAVIEIDGLITQGYSGTNILFGGKSTGSADIDRLTELIAKNKAIQGVIVRINSPGGSVLASDEIYESIKRLKTKLGKKPIYATIGSIGTSGGYYIALACDKIYANKATLTGSIGVISEYTNMEVFNTTLGIKKDTLKTGKFVDMGSNSRKLTDEEIAMLQTHHDEIFTLFKSKIKENRPITDIQLNTIAQGQVFTGDEALDLTLIDKIGHFYTAVTDISHAQQFTTSPKLLLYRPQPTPIESFLRKLM